MKFIFMTMIMEKDEKGRERESHIAYGKVQCILICALGLNVPESYSLVLKGHFKDKKITSLQWYNIHGRRRRRSVN